MSRLTAFQMLTGLYNIKQKLDSIITESADFKVSELSQPDSIPLEVELDYRNLKRSFEEFYQHGA